jgi:hypothetical protein
VAHLPGEVGAAERGRLERLAGRLLSDEPALSATRPFGAKVATGVGPWPALLLEDHSAIALFDKDGDVAYSHRALLLAGDGDQVAMPVRRCPDFEDYCRDVLGLGSVEVLAPAPGEDLQPLAVRCAEDAALVRAVAERARRSGGLNVMPYMSTGGVWTLAARIAERSGVSVRVAAPPPRLARRVNDKLWFSERVAEIFDRGALPPSHAAFGLAALAARLANLARHHAAVAVKITDSASSVGNLVLSARDIAPLSIEALRDKVCDLLAQTGWRGVYPLLVMGWEHPVIASPTIQLWIPNRDSGDCIVEGIFDQMVTGTGAMFSGAEPTHLSEGWQRRIAREAARLGFLFQELGYFGRCSFDAILVGSDHADAQLHWVECNGRWGGTSIPMTLANRLVGDWRLGCPIIIDRSTLHGPRWKFAAFLEAIEGNLFVPALRGNGAVVLSPGRIEQGTGLNIMILGVTAEASRECAAALAADLDAIGMGG